jgi:hypothetical protein
MTFLNKAILGFIIIVVVIYGFFIKNPLVKVYEPDKAIHYVR